MCLIFVCLCSVFVLSLFLFFVLYFCALFLFFVPQFCSSSLFLISCGVLNSSPKTSPISFLQATKSCSQTFIRHATPYATPRHATPTPRHAVHKCNMTSAIFFRSRRRNESIHRERVQRGAEDNYSARKTITRIHTHKYTICICIHLETSGLHCQS